MTITILWRDGFDHYLNVSDLSTVYAVTSGYNSFQSGRTDGKSIQIGGQSFEGNLAFQNFAAQSDFTMGVAVNPQIDLSDLTFTFYDISSGVVPATFDFTSANMAVVTIGGVSYTGNIPIIPLLNWTHIQCRAVLSSTAGSFEIRFNGSPTATFTKTAINTVTSGISQITGWQTRHNSSSGMYLDDLMLYTGGFLGDCRIQTDFPISDHSVAFTHLSGSSNFAMVNETAMDSDTTYNYTTTVGATDLFGFTTLVLPNGGTIIDVSLVSAARKDDAGARTFQHKISSGTGNSVGAATAVSTSYEYFVDTFTVDPGTSTAWTLSGLNAAFYGYLEQS